MRRADIPKKFLNAHGRLSNGFYRIRDRKGVSVPFYPNITQQRLLEAVYVHGRRRIVLPKARKLGCSTCASLVIFDAMNLRSNTEAAIIDMSEGDASKKLQHMVTFAHNELGRLRPELQRPTVRASTLELALGNGSFCLASASSRGSTPQVMLVSELGKIAHADPKRAEEIQTGAMNSVPASGLIIVESTAMGKKNFFHNIVTSGQQIAPASRTALDWTVVFGAWHDDPVNVLEGPADRVTRETNDYLNEIERLTGKTFTLGQRVWYQVQAVEEAKLFRFREYPSTVEECFNAPVEGAIYGDLIARCRANGQIVPYEWDRAYPVYASWDIGFSDTTDIWWFQLRLNRMDVIKHVTLSRHSAPMAANVIREAGIPVAGHLLPHDAANQTATSGSSYREELMRAGLRNIMKVERTIDVWKSINWVRDALPRCTFNLAGCKDGLAALEVYHAKDEKPVHDWSSHPADAFRTAIEGMRQGLVSDKGLVGEKPGRYGPHSGRGERTIDAWEGMKL
jgi:hypothetical protein